MYSQKQCYLNKPYLRKNHCRNSKSVLAFCMQRHVCVGVCRCVCFCVYQNEQEGFSSGILSTATLITSLARQPPPPPLPFFCSIMTQKLHVGQIRQRAFISTTTQSFLLPPSFSPEEINRYFSSSSSSLIPFRVCFSLVEPSLALCVPSHPTFLPFIQSQTRLSQESMDLFPHTHLYCQLLAHISEEKQQQLQQLPLLPSSGSDSYYSIPSSYKVQLPNINGQFSVLESYSLMWHHPWGK